MPALLVLSGPPSVHADLSRTRQEIAHRFHFIAAADGRFIRNGKDYDARAAHEPIRKKYDDLQSRIRSAEDFIRLAASRRNMGVAPYRFAGGERVLPCADWLRAELGQNSGGDSRYFLNSTCGKMRPPSA